MSKLKTHLSTILLIVMGLVVLVGAIGIYAFKTGEREVSEELLQSFYTFKLATIDKNDQRIQELTTPEIYESHTISSSNRQLRVYLKFQGKPTEAKVIRHEGNTIFYYIKSKGFDPERTFAMEYHYSWGKIDKIIEYEVFFLPQSSRSDME